MNIGAYFKSANLVESGEDNVWKLVFHVRKDRVMGEDLEDINDLQGGSVRLIATYTHDEDYESPRQKKNREEQDKYDNIMAEKRRSQAASELPLEGAAPEPATPGAITLPPVEIIKIGDYTDLAGNRYSVEYQSGIETGWHHVITPANDEVDIDSLVMDKDIYNTEAEAREALRVWAEVKRGYKPVAPEGYGTVYGICDDNRDELLRVGYNDQSSEGNCRFVGFTCREDGSEANPISGLSHYASPGNAQVELDEYAAIDSVLPVYGYINLSKIVLPLGEDEPASPAMIYEDGDGATYYVFSERDDQKLEEQAWWIATCEPGGDEKFFDIDNCAPFATQEDAQGALDAYALKNGWTPKPVAEILGEQEEPSQPAPLSETVVIGDFIIYTDAQVISTEAQCVTEIDPILRTLSTDKRVAPLPFEDLDAHWRMATADEIRKASVAQANPEPVPHDTAAEGQNVPTLFETIEEGKWVKIASAKGKPFQVGIKHEFRPSTNTPGDVYLEGHGTVFAGELNEHWIECEAPEGED